MRARNILPVLLVLCLACPVLADGCFVWNEGVDLYEPSQKAVIVHDDGIEDLILQVKYEGKATDFAWLVPLPAQPEVSGADAAIFAELSEYTQRRQHWHAFYGTAGRPAGKGKVEVLERKKVSVYDVAVLKADTAEALMQWLAENRYSVPEHAEALLREYIDKDWVFTALRIHSDDRRLWVEKALNKGTLIPLKFTFKSPQAVYPLKISSLNKGPTEVLLYVFADDVLVHADFHVDAPHVYEFVRYADPATEAWEKRAKKRFASYFDTESCYFRRTNKDELPKCQEVLPRLKEKQYFLCKLRNIFTAEQMHEDIVLRPMNKLSQREQYYFAKTQIGRGGFENSLLLHVKDSASEYFADTLDDLSDSKEDHWFCVSACHFLAIDPSDRDVQIMMAVALNEGETVRTALGRGLRHRFGFGRSSPPPSCSAKLVPILAQLVTGDLCNGTADAIECLGRIGSEEAIDILAAAAVNDAGIKRVYRRRTYPKRRLALEAMSHVSKPRLIAVYQDTFRRHKQDMAQDEIWHCLWGLRRTDDPAAIPLVQDILDFCIERNWTRDILKSRELLEHLRAQEPDG